MSSHSASHFPAVAGYRKLVITLVLLLMVPAACAGQSTQAASAAADLELKLPRSFSFIVYGDIRFTDPANVKASSPEMRDALVKRIAEAKPQVLAITGDNVLKGDDAHDWEVFDAESAPFRQAGLTILPSLGNHDLRGGEAGLSNYFQRFPQVKGKRWYSVHGANCYWFILDSSQDGPGGEQMQWLEQGLDHLPRGIDYVFFIVHHPPYTHSVEATGHAARPQEQRLGEFLEQKRAGSRAQFLVFAGHVHNYERYEHGGVTYIVTGGGGATPYPIPRSPEDHYRDDGPTYHYCQLTVNGRKLRFKMSKLKLEGSRERWAVRDKFQLSARRGQAAATAR